MADSYLEDLLAQASLELLKLRLLRQIPVASPAAGAEWTLAVPGGVIWELISVHARLVTSAVVANRQPNLVVADADSVEVARFATSAVVAASTTSVLSWVAGLGDSRNVVVQQNTLPAPPQIMQPGWILKTVTAAIDATDQYSQLVIVVREWDETALMQEIFEMDQNFGDYISQRNYTRENRKP